LRRTNVKKRTALKLVQIGALGAVLFQMALLGPPIEFPSLQSLSVSGIGLHLMQRVHRQKARQAETWRSGTFDIRDGPTYGCRKGNADKLSVVPEDDRSRTPLPKPASGRVETSVSGKCPRSPSPGTHPRGSSVLPGFSNLAGTRDKDPAVDPSEDLPRREPTA
jgi:hypothetical protein